MAEASVVRDILPKPNNSHGIPIMDSSRAALLQAMRMHDSPAKEFGMLLRMRTQSGAGAQIARFLEANTDLALAAKSDSRLKDMTIFFEVPGTDGKFKLHEVAEGALRHSLDAQKWPHMMVYGAEMFLVMQRVFAQGQIYIYNSAGMPVAGMNLARMDWDGTLKGLGSWDDFGRNLESYCSSHAPGGGFVVPFKISVANGHEGEGLPQQIFARLKDVLPQLGVQVLGDFRPSSYASTRWEKLEQILDAKVHNRRLNVLSEMNKHASFSKYVRAFRDDGLPVDDWLRNLTRNSRDSNGLHIIKVDNKATVIEMSLKEFEAALCSHSADYVLVGSDVWINRTLPGTFQRYPLKDMARYVEMRVWASLDL